MTRRHICLHGHFYQPPRDNPWLEAIEHQESAAPFHDWNERITAECYAPNAASRILGSDGRIERIVNNYARISFDFGPTLAAWLETAAPEVYAAVLAADRESARRCGGHGNALAQAYSHLILPLANRRDKETQIVWGLADFAHRFGRPAEGMWLPETAVDLESLDLLAAHGVAFTVLAPHQARRVRELPDGEWREVAPGTLDTTAVYQAVLPSGRTLALFFYDGAVSRAIAFEGLLGDGERFAGRLFAAFPAELDGDALVHVATDGETYGHHHRHGEMALSYALDRLQGLEGLEGSGLVRLTNYGEYLAHHPPRYEVEIAEDTAWSCAHGLGRWCADCGCHAGAPPGWNQAWRGPLRRALDGLRDDLAERFEEAAGALLADPWAARDAYVAVVLDRSPASVDAFFASHGRGRLSGEDRVTALKLLEMQRHAMLMYTSCGWFFNDVAGIEGVQILRYAGRAVQLGRDLFGDDGGDGGEAKLLAALARAASNDPRQGNGRDLYLRAVKPAAVDLPQVAAHYAIRSLFTDFPERAEIYCYAVEREVGWAYAAGRSRFALGRIRVTSLLTGESSLLEVAAVHFGDHNLSAGVRESAGGAAAGEELARFGEETRAAFEHGDLPRVVRLLDGFFQPAGYSLGSLLADDRRRILDQVLAGTLAEVEDEYRDIVRHHGPLVRSLVHGGLPVPRALAAAAELIANLDLERTLAGPEVDPAAVRQGLAEARSLGVALDGRSLGYAGERAVVAALEALRESPGSLPRLRRAEALVALAREVPFPVDLWRAQNLGYALWEELAKEEGEEWQALLSALGEGLSLRVATPAPR